jgi:aspartate kinase
VIVQKYGGSSVATPERIIRVAERVKGAWRRGPVAVVVSAMGDTTDDLLALLRQVSDAPPPREVDLLLAAGEQISAALLAAALEARGVPARALLGWQAGIATDGIHGKARIAGVDPERVRATIAEGAVAVVAGFQGVHAGEITTLGRGGSDTTAVALAAALGCPRCEIYSDVDGVYTADPRVVPAARRLSAIGYDEMMEMAHLGAQVLQIRAVELAEATGLVIVARSSFTDGPGTEIREVGATESEMTVRGVTGSRNIAKVTIRGVPDRPGFAHRLFAALAGHSVNVDTIVQSAPRDGRSDIIFTVARDDLPRTFEVARAAAAEVGAEAAAEEDVAMVSVVGAGMVTRPGVAATMFGALAEAGVNIEAITTSEIKISCMIRAADLEKAVRAVHAAFGLDA